MKSESVFDIFQYASSADLLVAGLQGVNPLKELKIRHAVRMSNIRAGFTVINIK